MGLYYPVLILNYRYFVPKGTKIDATKNSLVRIFWKELFRQPRLGNKDYDE